MESHDIIRQRISTIIKKRVQASSTTIIGAQMGVSAASVQKYVAGSSVPGGVALTLAMRQFPELRAALLGKTGR